jgi:hypothetical protein
MTAPVDDIHSKAVEEWLKTCAQGLDSAQKILLLEKAIHAIEKRARITLSSITLLVVLDRILQNVKETFPVLDDVRIEKDSLSFPALEKNHSPEEMVKALTLLLVELLRVLGRLTANILTKPLHMELMKVTANDSGES